MQKSKSDLLTSLDWDDLRYFLAVARVRTASGAAKLLGVNYTTVARRIRSLEQTLGVLLFEKSRTTGFVLTREGEILWPQVDALETQMFSVRELFQDEAKGLSGHVRVACTEAFGTYFLAPHLGVFQQQHPHLHIDLLPLPHFVSLSKREADLLITLERPQQGAYVTAKLCDYNLGLYACAGYLANHPTISSIEDLAQHAFVSYVDNLAFSHQLLYLEATMPNAMVRFRSTSVVAQAAYVRAGQAIGILPCFLADPDPNMVRVLPDLLQIKRTFWLCCREDLWGLQRIKVLWQHLRDMTDKEKQLLLGKT
mgnify:FL=1